MAGDPSGILQCDSRPRFLLLCLFSRQVQRTLFVLHHQVFEEEEAVDQAAKQLIGEAPTSKGGRAAAGKGWESSTTVCRFQTFPSVPHQESTSSGDADAPIQPLQLQY